MAAHGLSTEELYRCYEVLEGAKGEAASEHQSEYELLLTSQSSSTGVKRLAASFVVKFSPLFPSLVVQALDCLCDLLEDEDSAVRQATIKCLPEFASTCPDHTSKVADVLTQMLMTEDPTELDSVKKALTTTLKKNTKDTLLGIFEHIDGEDEVLRERAVQFVQESMQSLRGEVFGPGRVDNEKELMENIKKSLCTVLGDGFQMLTGLLGKLDYCNTPNGIQDTIVMVTEVANLDGDFKAVQERLQPDWVFASRPYAEPASEDVGRLVECTKEAIVWCQRGGVPSAFYQHFVHKMLPKLGQIPEEPKHELLRLLTSLVTFDLPEDVRRGSLEPVYTSLNSLLPEPTEGEEPVDETLQFSLVECLLFVLHSLVQKKVDTLSGDQLARLRPRLTYFSRGCQLYHRQLQRDLASKTDKELLEDQNTMKLQAKAAIDNILALIRDLFHNPPVCTTAVKLSFIRANPYDKKGKVKAIYTGRPFTGPTPTPGAGGNRKRINPVTYDIAPDKKPKGKEGGKPAEGGLSYYQPPRGTFSSKVTANSEDWGQMGQYGYRGRGRGRGWRGRGNGVFRGWRRGSRFSGQGRGWRRSF